MVNKLFNLLSSGPFIRRFLSAIIIIPIMILPVLLGGYSLILVYLTILIFVVDEIIQIIRNSNYRILSFIYLFVSTVSIILFIIQLISIDVRELFILIIFTIWIFDTFSYLGGSILKGKKIFPKISRGKTYSGLFSGLFGTMVFYFLFSIYFDFILPISYHTILIIIILAFAGDALASHLKRLAFIKDSGDLIPGHGGFLDRLDSFIFVFFVVAIYFLFV